MNTRILIIVLVALIFGWNQAHPQKGHSYRKYDRERCRLTRRDYNSKPDEVLSQVHVTEDKFVAVFNDEEWFYSFFQGSGNNLIANGELSLGVQLVCTNYFSCTPFSTDERESYFYHLDPLSYRDMKRQQVSNEYGLHFVPWVRFLHGFRVRNLITE